MRAFSFRYPDNHNKISSKNDVILLVSPSGEKCKRIFRVNVKCIRISIFVLLVFSLSLSVFADEKKSIADSKVNNWRLGEFSKIRTFGSIEVHIKGNDARKMGLTENELFNHIKLQLNKNFSMIKYEDMSEKWITIKEPGKVGKLIFSVWVVGNYYPFAYLLEYKAESFAKDETIWGNRVLGYGSEESAPDEIKKHLNRLIEEMAIDYFDVNSKK